MTTKDVSDLQVVQACAEMADEPDAIVATERELLSAYLGTIEELSDETEDVTVSMPLQLTPEMLRAVREDDSTRVEDFNEWHQRLGWLICAYDVLVAVRTKTPNADVTGLAPEKE